MDITERLFARTEALRYGMWSRNMWIIVIMVVGGWAWASYAMIEEQIRAPGVVIASSRSQIVQVIDGGVLHNLHVREGDTVKAGDLIAELKTDRAETSQDEARAKVVSLSANIERLQAELAREPLKFSKDVRVYDDIVVSQRRLHERRLQFQSEEKSAIERSLRLATDELESMERLAATGDAAATEVLRARRQVNELQGTLTNKLNGYRQEAQSDLVKSRSELEGALQQLILKGQAVDATQLKAPMSGIVKNVKVTTLGGVLKPGDELLQIVPTDDVLIIEAKVKSADVGFLRKDLHANVKLDAFDSTVYGSLEGHVTYISADVLEGDLRKDEQPTYRVHIEIDKTPDVRNKAMEIIPGMSATAEIITGERSVAQYLLKPIRRGMSAALVER